MKIKKKMIKKIQKNNKNLNILNIIQIEKEILIYKLTNMIKYINSINKTLLLFFNPFIHFIMIGYPLSA